MVAYEGTSEGPKQLAAEAILSWGLNVRNCPDCKTTKYFGEAQDKLYPDLQKSVKELQAKCPDCKVLFTGHSLGGAMAQIGAYKMLKDGTLKEPVCEWVERMFLFVCSSSCDADGLVSAHSPSTTRSDSPKRVTRPSTKRSTK